MVFKYPPIPGTSPIEGRKTDLPADGSIPPELLNPGRPVQGDKNIFAYWHQGIENLDPYLRRNVLSWYAQFAHLGWNIFVFDSVPGSPLNIRNFLDFSNPTIVPDVLREGDHVTGGYHHQHTSDLIRFPLLIQYGGVYMDTGILQFGDLDWLWTKIIQQPRPVTELAGFKMGSGKDITIVNFWMMCKHDNPLILRAHMILLELWKGRTHTSGMHQHPLVVQVPLLKVPEDVKLRTDGTAIDDGMMTDYAIQIQALGAAMRLADDSDGWHGPRYTMNRCWLYDMVERAYVNETLTNWDSARQAETFATPLPLPGSEETEAQRLGRMMVTKCFTEGWALKLAHGFSAKLFGAPTLGMLWRDNPGSDCIEGTYGGWLRWAMMNLKPDPSFTRSRVPSYHCHPTIQGSFPE